MVRAHFNGDRERKLYNPPSNRDRSLRNATDYLLNHEERRAKTKQYNGAGALFIPNFPIRWQDFITRGFRQLTSTGGSRLLSKAQVIVYSKPGCHLCDEAKEAIRSAGCDDKFELTEINIETDPALMAKYGYDIPVIAINGVETFIHRVDPKEFRARILSGVP